ncbi:GH92 family glycosyl hydrolase [Terrimonas sp. NA20]|uniref:GH92 family glycosyl hydrolase n=1 Tax=Terrimonas ginsenosidimutans TaxID=2908004 RepID=A0ABS9KM67_9BACT|nr:GH92 family glycosyl hydrolase [Terrimonas ginsenosidimutans]MCG2613416.1 GH92 family glycosyl hydrolase [Terrimonas ginsenosidimutans]
MRKYIAACFILITIVSLEESKAQSLTKYVNTFIGTAPLTDSAILGYKLPEGWRSWAGLVYPGSSLPNAMVQLSPITEYGSGAGYEYEDSLIYGFAHTNKGHWNLCNIPVLPLSNAIRSNNQFSSRFSHTKEKASPAFYQVFLDDYKVSVSLTSTLRCGYHQYIYQNNKNRQILFDLARSNNRVSSWEIQLVDKNILQGHQQTSEGKMYFYALLNTAVDSLQKQDGNGKEGFAIVHLKNGTDKPVEMKLALSFVSIENAKLNLQTEIGNRSFKEICNEGNNTWEKLLSTVKLKGGTAKEKQLFYTSIYRSFLWPALRSDVNGDYRDAKDRTGRIDYRYYTVPSLWDTYRNREVLSMIILPDVTRDIIRSLKDMGDKTGFIPTFFHGDHAAALIAGAYLRGIDGFDINGAYQLLLRNATIEGGTRPHIAEYIEKGYISDPDVEKPWVETKGKAGVSKTLEYAYDDHSLALLAKKLGDTANYAMLMKRSKNYQHVFDASSRFMRGRLPNGDWIKNFDPQYPYYEYMFREANAWQVSFYVPHDMDGLIKLYGGKDRFEQKLDSFYTLPWNPTHIARNVESMIGQYCHGNQPDHEAPFAYHFIGKPEKSQKILDTIMRSLYGIGKDGLALCGMDDAGEMSSWYVFSSLGIYPFSPADDKYIISVPLFDEVNWKTSTGKMLTIRKLGNGRNMTGISLNGKKLEGYFVGHDVFTNGGLIEVSVK